MFTGIVEGLATVERVESIENGIRLHFASAVSLSDCVIGDSIAIDGCCLTAVAVDATSFVVEATHETLKRTTLIGFEPGTRVNLERALLASARLGGHFVQGHVDATAKLIRIEPQGDATDVYFELPASLRDFVVEKGSITVDGVSLTVNGVQDDSFDVTLIPHTTKVTTIGHKKTGDRVNLETDMIGKYIVKMIKERGLA